ALYLHGADDGCIGPDFAEAGAGFLTNAQRRTAVVEGAGHFLQLGRPERENAEILGFRADVTRWPPARRCPTASSPSSSRTAPPASSSSRCSCSWPMPPSSWRW